MTTADASTECRDALVERLFEAVLGFDDLHAVYLGDRLGLYRALSEGAETPAEVATAASCDERYVRMYGWSVLHCLPDEREEQPSAETGTVMRTSTFTRYANEAGFENVEVVPIEHDFWRFYRLQS